MKLLFTTLFLIFTVTIFAQKFETTENSCTSDFTTTPFQDGSTAKDISRLFSEFSIVEGDTYEEGNVKVLIPMTFNPNETSFKINGDIAVLKLCIYNIEGDKIFEGKMTNNWNGKDDKNSKVKNGLYIYTVEGRINPGSTSKFAGVVKIKTK